MKSDVFMLTRRDVVAGGLASVAALPIASARSPVVTVRPEKPEAISSDDGPSLWGEKPNAQIEGLISEDRTRIERLLAQYDGPLLSQVKAWNATAYAAGVGTLVPAEAVTLQSPPTLAGSN